MIRVPAGAGKNIRSAVEYKQNISHEDGNKKIISLTEITEITEITELTERGESRADMACKFLCSQKFTGHILPVNPVRSPLKAGQASEFYERVR